ncbi:ataxin-2-like isoform X6 [Sinocyclocheilus anshuiensis]|uniref:ataxin-2-like isoform X6 n=1 Tax=Sinocyclocheilus anshuiensis TaxID=1608454 RepID=UPI0007BAC2F8|nr:PREDICTED: ataxin-2-like isoform X6 [Sinocyclocheilus anshuiensis]
MSMKPQAGGNRKPGGSNSGAAAASGTGGAGGGVGRQNIGRGRNNAKGPSTAVAFSGVYANMRMVHVLTSVVGTKCELKVKNGLIYEGVFKTYGPECDIVLDAAHRKSVEPSVGPRREDIVESIIFKSSDVVVVHFKDVDLNYAKKVSSDADNFTDSAVSARLNGEHKEKDLEPWDGGEQHISGSMESLDTDLSNGWDPDEMFKYNEETYGVKSTYDSSLSSYTVPLERDNSEEFLKREARASQLAEEIEASATYKARVALENDDRSEEEKYTAVVRGERELHSLNRENKYIPPSQRNREAGMSWGAGRQNSPRLVQCSPGPPAPRSGPHDYNTMDQRVVNGGVHPWPSRCPSPSSRPPSRYQSGPTNSLPPRAATPTRPPSRPPSRPSRPLSHPSAHGSTGPLSTIPKRLSSEGPPRMSPKSQRTPRPHRVASCRGGGPPPPDYMSQGASVEVSAPPPTRNSPSGGTWSSVVSGAHRPRSPRQNSIGGGAPSPSCLSSPQAGTVPVDSATASTTATSPTAANLAANLEASPIEEAKESRVLETRQNSPNANKENVKPTEASASIARSIGKGPPSMAPDHRKQIDNLKKFSVDFRLQSSSNPDPVFEPMVTKPPRDLVERPKDQAAEKNTVDSTGPKVPMESAISEQTSTAVGAAPTGSKSGTPLLSPSSAVPEQKRGPDVTSQGVQTSSPLANAAAKDKDEKEEKNDPVAESVRRSTLNPNAKEFNPRVFCSPPKPATTPTQTRPQGQPSPSIVVQQPPTVYGQTMFQMYPLTPVSPGVQKSIIWKPPAMYHVQVPHMTMSQTKHYRPGKVPNMPQQRPDQHHPPGTSTMMHPATAAGPPIVAPSPAYSTQYFTCSPQQFATQPLVQQMTHYQSQAQHVFSPVIQGSARMITPPAHAQPSLVSSSTTQYVSPAPLPQQYPHPSSTLHPHSQHPQPSATPTGQPQQGTQHGGSHPAPSPVQHSQHQAAAAAAQAMHLGNPPQQQMYTALAPTPPSMTPGPNPQSPQASFQSAQQAVYIHPQQVQHGYNPNHMAHVQQAHMQSGMVPPHHGTPSHPPTMMLMATQAPAGPQPTLSQGTLNPIPVSSATHYSYTLTPVHQSRHPNVRFVHRPQMWLII